MKPKLLIVIGFVMAAAAIVYTALNRPSANAPTPAEMIAQLTKFKDRACACKDKACADALGDEMIAFTKRMSDAVRPSDDEVKKLTELGRDASTCLARLVDPNGSGSASGSGASAAKSVNGAIGALASGSTGGATGPEVDLPFEYSTEKQDWLQAAVDEFQKLRPNIHVKLIGKGSLDSANAILNGDDHPVLWSPADSLVANLLAADWQTKNNKPLFPASGDGAPQPLLLTPMVFVVWEERAKVLADPSNTEQLSWKLIEKAVSSPKGWAGIGGKPGWGFVTLGHTDPTKSNSGMQALALMAYEYFHTTSGLTVDQTVDPKFQEFVKNIERGVGHFESSTGTFMTDMIRFGPSKYDIAVVYESLAISQLDNAQGRWGNLHIYYPPVTIWSDHPIALLDAPWVTPAQKTAAAQLIAYLRSVPAQSTAVSFGFRPANTQVAVKTNDPNNPFSRGAQFGLTLDLPPVAQPPDAAVIRNLLMMWSRIVKPK